MLKALKRGPGLAGSFGQRTTMKEASKAQPGSISATVSSQPVLPMAKERQPTWPQKLMVLVYAGFIPAFLLLNVLLLVCNRWTRLAWIVYTMWINFGPGKWAQKNGSWPKLLRRLPAWQHMAEYFPCSLIKTAELDPEQRYIFVIHPHGIGTVFAWPCFDTEATGFSEKFPGIDIHAMTLEVNFRLPLMREFLLLHGVVDASKTACLTILGKGSGKAILLAVGGAQESLHAQPGTYDLVLNKRKGFVKIALQTGAKLVPVLGFGENDLQVSRPPVPGSLHARIASLFKATLGFTLPAFQGTGLFTQNGILPYPKPLQVVVGAPIAFDVTRCPGGENVESLDAMVNTFHAQYVEALKGLWDAHKNKYAKGRRRSLCIVE